ncbi:MAG: 4Fe-4S dicluster domain-containing protein, partial [Dehalococcoidales bacterium]
MTVRNALERVLSRAQLEVVPGRCLRAYHRRASCRLCLDSCPDRAVSLDGSPEVDYSRCRCCGVCANLCPTGVFRLLEPSYESLVARARGRDVVEFGCAQSASAVGGMVSVPCLGYLNEAVLVAVAVGGAAEIRLDVSDCEECRFEGGLAVAIETMRRANRLLSLFGLPDRVSAWTSDRGNGKGNGNRDGNGDRRYSRREFLSYLGRGTRSVAAGTGSPAATGRDGDAGRRPGPLTPSLPEKRRMLLDHLSRLGPPFTGEAVIDGAPFARVTIGDDCDGCGMCVSFCPTGALAWCDEGDRRALTFGTADCLACGLCREICPRDDVSLEPTVCPGDIVARTVTTL